jgi:O-acetylserine/cysteine efflux transporter
MVWVSTVPVLPLLGLSLLLEGPGRDADALRALDWQGAGTVVYVAWVTTVFGFGAWGWLLRRHPASTVAPFSLLVPVFGMSSAALFLGEGISPLRWCAAALLVGGVAVTSLAPARRGGPGIPVDGGARVDETRPGRPAGAGRQRAISGKGGERWASS